MSLSCRDVAITSRHPDVELQYDELFDETIGAGCGLWRVPAVLADDSSDGEVSNGRPRAVVSSRY